MSLKKWLQKNQVFDKDLLKLLPKYGVNDPEKDLKNLTLDQWKEIQDRIKKDRAEQLKDNAAKLRLQKKLTKVEKLWRAKRTKKKKKRSKLLKLFDDAPPANDTPKSRKKRGSKSRLSGERMAIPHSEEQFKLFSTTHMSVDITERLITKTSHGAYGGSTVYGMVTFGHHLSDMSYDENAKGFLRYNKHKWVFKVHKRGMGHMAIGIDNSDGKYTNVCPFTQKNTLNYSYWSSGKKCESDNKSAFNIGWDEGDVIVMYYLCGWLVFLVNEQNLKKAFNINTPSKTQYRMCVYMQNKHDCVSLLSYSCGDKISP
eukprot:1029445_1